MMKGLTVDENMSNLSVASGEASASASSAGTRNEAGHHMYRIQSFSSSNQAPAAKKRRSLPGNPDPDAEVIALSPKTLMATNRFICEICNKGFQRDQNLQLHRRGHNLPWKLKQRANKEVIRKKVYVCPESTCVHHDPSRALGDLTGIKKHFCRKHGEKKWKCEKCSKRYAVQTDWKAHSKICGTKEYRCDCGTLFSRRDSFITHRAFCDALAEESARAINLNPLRSTQPGTNLQPQLMYSHGLQTISMKRENFNPRTDNIPPWLVCPPVVENSQGPPPPLDLSSSPLFSRNNLDQSFDHHENHNPNPNSFQPTSTTSSPHMSATGLLQKASQMGVTMSRSCSSVPVMLRPHHAHVSATATGGCGLDLSSREEMGSGFFQGVASFGNKVAVCNSNSSVGFDGSSFEEAYFSGIFNQKREPPSTESQTRSRSDERAFGGGGGGGGGNDGLTRDFLGLKSFPPKGFVNIAEIEQMNKQQNPNHTLWHA